jgi:hypothetical protein
VPPRAATAEVIGNFGTDCGADTEAAISISEHDGHLSEPLFLLGLHLVYARVYKRGSVLF